MDVININVGGTVFTTRLSTLGFLPDTRLGRLKTSSDEYNRENDWFFFDRNPELFQNVLDLYRHGSLHVPGNICGATLKRELEYWEIPLNKIPICCLGVICRHEEMMSSMEQLKMCFASDQVAVSEEKDYKSGNTFQAARRIVWLFLTSRHSSLAAKIFNVFYYLMASLSVMLFVLGTHPACREPRPTVLDSGKLLDDYASQTPENDAASSNTTFELKPEINPKYKMYFTTRLTAQHRIMDLVCLIFFTLELLLRLLTCPSVLRLYRSFLNVLDTAVIVGLLIAFGLEQQLRLIFTSRKIFWLYAVCKSLVIFRIIRLFRLSRDVGGLRVLTLAVKSSMKQLLSLGASVLITIVFCSSVIYYLEIYQGTSLFTNIPITIWWSIITVTTVGYGDVTPSTPAGYIIGSLFAVCGILLVALPIAIVATTFGDLTGLNRIREREVEIDRGPKTDNSLAVRERKVIVNKIHVSGK